MSGLFFVHMNQPHPTGIATCDHQQHSSCHGMAVGRIDHSQMESQADNESNARVQRISKFPYEIVEILHTARYSKLFCYVAMAMGHGIFVGRRDQRFQVSWKRTKSFTMVYLNPHSPQLELQADRHGNATFKDFAMPKSSWDF